MKLLDNLSMAEIEALMLERRLSLATKAARIYSECRSLRKTAGRMNVSHETVRTLLRESQTEASHDAAGSD
jgi:orotate phosphoribosyltransferase-like protein